MKDQGGDKVNTVLCVSERPICVTCHGLELIAITSKLCVKGRKNSIGTHSFDLKKIVVYGEINMATNFIKILYCFI